MISNNELYKPMFEKDDKEVNLIILINRPKITAPSTTKDRKPPLKPQKK